MSLTLTVASYIATYVLGAAAGAVGAILWIRSVFR
jgi:hypothetical protein